MSMPIFESAMTRPTMKTSFLTVLMKKSRSRSEIWRREVPMALLTILAATPARMRATTMIAMKASRLSPQPTPPLGDLSQLLNQVHRAAGSFRSM